jgi:hypothetical protein
MVSEEQKEKDRAERWVDISLAEYESHQDSYTSLRGQYLTFLTIVVIALGAVDTVIFNVDKPPSACGRGLSILSAYMVMISMLVAHVIGLRGLCLARDRIKELEIELGMKPFDSTWQLRMAIWTTFVVNIIAIVAHSIIFVDAFDYVGCH